MLFSLLGQYACVDSCKASDTELTGFLSSSEYLTGRFNPRKQENFVSLKSLGIPTNRRDHRLRRETALALKKMYTAFHKAHPRVPFRVISSTRNFYVQKSIWEAKWTGRRKVGGRSLARSIKDPLKRGLKILQYSSMPGTSRHHWGTDFDLTNLNNAYFKKGKGAVLFKWLRANGPTYGFCQPYTAGRKSGYQEERWHWSYRPLSAPLLKQWNLLYKRKAASFQKKSNFAGAASAGKLAPVYVNSVSVNCK